MRILLLAIICCFQSLQVAMAQQAILGDYPVSNMVTAGGSTVIFSSMPPENITGISVSAPVTFKGILTTDVFTGDIIVTNASPAGVYPVTVKAVGSTGTISATFSLTVTNNYCSQGLYAIAPTVNTGSLPFSAYIGDFNNDGNQDIVTANYGGNNVSVRLGNGTGGFYGNSVYNTGLNPQAVAIGDFNADGKQDLAVANFSGSSVSVLIGDGTGGFGNAVNIAVGTYPYSIATGDFNNDGFTDLATADYGSNRVSILTGNGTGTFFLSSVANTGTGPRSLVVSDFNSDGKADIATANFDQNSASILTGYGNGTFSGAVTIAAGNRPHSITTGDFNADGKQDIALANFNGNNVTILLANGSGGFTSAPPVPVGNNPRKVISADFNGDGYADIVTANVSSNSLSIRLGNGLGAFTGNIEQLTGSNPYTVVSGDFDKDGIIDLLSANAGANNISVFTGRLNEIDVTGNNVTVNDGDHAPSLLNFTDFGNVSTHLKRTFSIQNTGAVKLNVKSILLSGPDSARFTLGGISLPYELGAGSSVNFSVDFAPAGPGLKTATVKLINDDCDESEYDFGIQGNGYIPDIPVLGDYPDVLVPAAGGNTTVTPSAIPSSAENITATTSPVFKGQLTVSPSTGVVRVTNAHPAGSYMVHLKVNGVVPVTDSFLLTVNNTLCSQGLFSGAVNYSTGNGLGYPLAAGDFNADGYQDLAIAVNNTVSVLTGNPAGGFVQTAAVPVGNSPYAIAAGDINGDGKADLATANSGSNDVSVLFGNGFGAFGNITSLPVGTSPRSIIISDLNSDGLQDIATANYNSQSVSICYGNGYGSFTAPVSLTAGNNPNAILVTDFNGDGRRDLAVANYGSNSVSVLLADTTGGFTASTYIPVGGTPFAFTTGDFNSDGKQDIATANYNTGTVSVRYGEGTGAFNGITELPVGTGPRSITTGDYNGDGKTDLVTANFTGNSVTVRLGKGNGTFNAPVTNAMPGNPATVITGDFNGDGIQDLATANTGTSVISVLQGNVNDISVSGNGTMITDGDNSPSVTDNTDFGNVNSSLAKEFTISNAGAVNLKINMISITGPDSAMFSIGGASLPMIVSAGGSAGFTVNFTPASTGFKNASVKIENDDCDESVFDFAITGNGQSEFTPTLGSYPATIIAAAGGNALVAPTAAPTNAPFITAYTSVGFKGVLYADPVTGTVHITNAYPAGSYWVTVKVNGITTAETGFLLTVQDASCSRAQFSFAPDAPAGNLPFSVAVGDFNNDGKQDLATADYSGNTVTVTLGDGIGGFTVSGNIGVGINPNSVATGDFNGDGKLDLAVTNYGSSNVSIRLGDGTGGFFNSADVWVGPLPTFISTGDFNADGKKDLAVMVSGNTTVAIRLGDGNGNFSGTGSVPVGSGAFSIALGDFNGDGKQDIASADYNIDTVSINAGDGAGGFSLASQIEVDLNPYAITTGDFNGDGYTDLVTANFNGDNVSVRFGNGTGNFSGTMQFPVGDGPGSVTTGDFNGDGKTDIVTTNYSSNSVSLLLGNGAGGFTPSPPLPLNATPYLAVTGDFNSDGKQDLAIAKNNNTVSVLLGTDREITVKGNGILIADGDHVPGTADNTDFGVGNFTSRVFTIENTGTGNLSVGGISITGTDASLFTVSPVTYPVTIPQNASFSFVINFVPLNAGVKSAVVNIINDDCNESLYDFTLQGTYECPPLALAISGLPAVLCANAPAITINGIPSGNGIFTGPGITAGSNGTAVFDPAAAGTSGPVMITYNYTDPVNGCDYTTSQTVILNELPVLDFTGLPASSCVNASPFTLAGMPAAGVFSGPGVSGNIFSPAVAGAGTHHVVYTFTDINGCSNSLSKTVTVNALPAVSISGLQPSYCANAAPVEITGIPAGGLFSGPGISGNLFSPSLAGTGGPYTILYEYTDLNGCSNASTAVVTIDALPALSIAGLAGTYCSDAVAVTLTGFPAGGTFSGNGISGNMFYPAVAGIGTHAVTYSYTGSGGCSNSLTQTVSVEAPPVVSISGLATAYCNTDPAVTFTANPPGGIFSFSGSAFTDHGNGLATFYPSSASAGNSFTVTYIYTNANGCTSVATHQVMVNDCPAFATLNLKLFLEGYCNGSGNMAAVLFNLGMDPDPAATDSITVNLWSPFNLSSPMPDYSAKALLHTDGSAALQYPAGVIGNSFYIAVKHRNSLETWSRFPVGINMGTYYDFSTGYGQAFDDGVNNPLVLIAPGLYAIYSGDVNQDGTVDASDMSAVDNDNSVFAFGYNQSDLSGDGATDASDIALVDNNQQLFLFYARPY